MNITKQLAELYLNLPTDTSLDPIDDFCDWALVPANGVRVPFSYVWQVYQYWSENQDPRKYAYYPTPRLLSVALKRKYPKMLRSRVQGYAHLTNLNFSWQVQFHLFNMRGNINASTNSDEQSANQSA